MAIIKQKDIYDDSKSLFTNLQKDLEKLNNEVLKLSKSNATLTSSLQNVKKSSDGTEAKELVRLTNQLNTSTNKLNLAESEQAKKLAAVKVEQQRLNKTNRDSAILANKNISLYKKESAKLTTLRKKYKDLALQKKENTKAGKALLNSLQKLDSKLKKVDNSVGQNQRSVGKYSTALKGLGKQLLGGFGIVAAFGFLASAVRNGFNIFSTFERSNARLAAILGKTKIEITLLTEQSKELGAVTAFTASEISGLQTELAKLGFDITDISNMTESVLDLAAATGADLASAAELTGATLNIFDLSAKESTRVANVLAIATTKSSLSFKRLSTALPTVGKTAQIAGLSLERTVALLGNLTDRGLEASTASTALRNVFLQLSKKGITWKDALEKINNSSDKNKTSMELFGDVASATGVILAQTQGSTEVLTGALEDLDSTAKDVADTMLDNVAGDITKANSAWEGFVLSIADGNGIVSKAIRSVVQSFTDFIGVLTTFNKTSISTKLKVIANGFLDLMDRAFVPLLSILETLGVEVPKFRFDIDEVEKSTKGLGKTTKILSKGEQALIDKIKETSEETVTLTAAQKKLNDELRVQSELEKAYNNRDTGVVKPVHRQSTGLVDEKTKNDALLGLTNTYLADKANIEAVADEERKKAALERQKAFEKAINEIKEVAWSSAVAISTNIFNSFRDENNAKIQSAADAEIEILKNKLDKGSISEKEFAAKKEKIEKKARRDKAKEDRNAALWEIVINTAVGVVKSIANLGLPAAIPSIIATVAMGALQAGVILANPLPKLAEGEINIKGKSHSNGGINAEIEGGESVIKKSATANSENLLNMVNDGVMTDDIFNNIAGQNVVLDNKIITNLLNESNLINNKILMSMLNMGYSYDRGGVRNIIRADGSSVEKFNINE